MQVPFVGRDSDPAAPGCHVPHVASEDEREQQRQEKDRKKYNRQLFPLGQLRRVGTRFPPTIEYCSSSRLPGSELTGSLLRPSAFRGLVGI